MRITTSAILATLASLINAQSVDIPIPNDPALIDVQALSSHDSVNLASSGVIFEDTIENPISHEQVTTSSKKIWLCDGIHLPKAVEATSTPDSAIIRTAPGVAPTYGRAPQTSAGLMPATATPAAGHHKVEIVTVVQQIPTRNPV